MAKGKRRRHVVWRTVGAVAHAWVVGRTTSACDAFALKESGLWTIEEKCRQCEIVLDQTW